MSRNQKLRNEAQHVRMDSGSGRVTRNGDEDVGMHFLDDPHALLHCVGGLLGVDIEADFGESCEFTHCTRGGVLHLDSHAVLLGISVGSCGPSLTHSICSAIASTRSTPQLGISMRGDVLWLWRRFERNSFVCRHEVSARIWDHLQLAAGFVGLKVNAHF